MTQICSPIKVSYVPDCISCHKTTQETIPYDFNTSSPLQYVTFPVNPNAGDLHIALFRDYTSYYKYTGTEWNNEGYKMGITDSGAPEWGDILNKPTTFTPAAHLHPISEVVNLQTTLTGLQNDLTVAEGDIADLQTNKAEAIHTHVIADVTGLQQELDDINTAISLTGDNWGTQVVEHDSTLTGTGVVGDLLSLADGAVTETKIQNGAVTTLKVVDGAITNPKIADLAVTTTKLSNSAVTDIKIANGSVTTNKLGDSAVIDTKISDGAVTTNKIANNSVTIDKLPAGGSSITFLNGVGSWATPAANIAYAEDILTSGDVNLTNSELAIVSLSLSAGTWLISATATIDSNSGGTALNEAILYNETAAQEIFRTKNHLAANLFASLSLQRAVVLGGTSTISLRLSGNQTAAINNQTIITAIKLS